MPKEVREFSIFLSSPGDVEPFRKAVGKVVAKLNNDPMVKDCCRLALVAWDAEGARVPLLGNLPPQASVNRFIGRPSECDLTVAILWSRIGTPPVGVVSPSGKPIPSGTVWEIEEAKAAGKDVLVYHCTEEPKIGIRDKERAEKERQYQQVEDYCTQLSKDLALGIHCFYKEDEFVSLLEEGLKHFLAESPSMASESAPTKTSAKPSTAATPRARDKDFFPVLLAKCDRSTEAQKLKDLVKEAQAWNPPQAILTFLCGHSAQDHRPFLRRVCEDLRAQWSASMAEEVRHFRLLKDVQFDSAARFGSSILGSLADIPIGVSQAAAGGPSGSENALRVKRHISSAADLPAWLEDAGGRVFLLDQKIDCTGLSASDIERLFGCAGDWASDLPALPPQRVLVLVLSLVFRDADESSRPWGWLGRLATLGRRSADRGDLISAIYRKAFPSSQQNNELLRPLVVLPSVEAQHVSDWFEMEDVAEALADRTENLRQAVNAVYATSQARKLPLGTIREALEPLIQH